MTATDVFKAGSNALITGGASGVGLAIAKLCVSKDMKVLIVDRDTAALEAAKKELPGEVITTEADVSSTSHWDKIKNLAIEKLGSVELLVLNAGTGMKGSWGDEDYFRKTLETNLFGVINGIGAGLPLVKKAAETKPTSIVITGSKQGITNPPGNPAYNASKAAVKSLTEQLSYDLKDTKTSVHLLVPGWTHTGLTGAAQGKEKPAGAWAPEQVADFLYKKMAEDKFYVICPDNEVTEETDKKRMLYSMGDVVYERPPLSRWREEWKEKANDTISKTKI